MIRNNNIVIISIIIKYLSTFFTQQFSNIGWSAVLVFPDHPDLSTGSPASWEITLSQANRNRCPSYQYPQTETIISISGFPLHNIHTSSYRTLYMFGVV